MKVLRADQYATVPWRNGGGTTREIAVHRDPILHDDFLWRLSIADVSVPGPFSRFEGVDRTIALLRGGGMALRGPDVCVDVTAESPPFSFDGEAQVSCGLIAGPTLDLNVMSRRGFFHHTLRREEFEGWATVRGSADQTFVVSNGLVEFSWRGHGTLGPLDTIAEIHPGDLCELHADRSIEVFIVELGAVRIAS